VDAPAPAAPRKAPPFRRLDLLSEDELRKQLLAVPEVALDRVPDTSAQLVSAAVASRTLYQGPATLLGVRPDLGGLPFLNGPEVRLGKKPAESLDTLSKALHGHVQACTSGKGPEARTDAALLRDRLHEGLAGAQRWHGAEALPALLQVLQAEEAPVRLVLVEVLRDIDDPRAQAALAVRALVDLSAEVRQAAVRALARRPPDTYRGLLLAGFRYPWPPVAAHAAEALVALRDTAAVPALDALLDEQAPDLPQAVAVREMVRVNHLHNCLLCHPPSFSDKDPVRGVVPVPGRSPGATRKYYEGGPTDVFVRADITYLRQDFSFLQPVARPPRQWPAIQRYDYFVRVRTPTTWEWRRGQERFEQRNREYRAVVQFALGELAGAGDRP
jgi:hypothetical protein